MKSLKLEFNNIKTYTELLEIIQKSINKIIELEEENEKLKKELENEKKISNFFW